MPVEALFEEGGEVVADDEVLVVAGGVVVVEDGLAAGVPPGTRLNTRIDNVSLSLLISNFDFVNVFNGNIAIACQTMPLVK